MLVESEFAEVCSSSFFMYFLKALYWDKSSNIDCYELSLVEIIRLSKLESF